MDPIDFIDTDNAKTQDTDKAMSEGAGVEVVLDRSNKASVVVSQSPGQNVYRAPDAVRPRAVTGQGGRGPVNTSGSYGYDYGHASYPVPSYARSSSFDEGAYPTATTSHYSPHVQYPPPGRHSGDVNVISPNHKEHSRRPPMTPRQQGHHSYHYPPASPVRSGGQSHSPQRIRNYAMRRPEGPYSAAQRNRGRHADDGTWNAYPSQDRSRPPIVTESSFDSEHYSSHPTTPNAAHYGPPMHGHPESHHGFYAGESLESFDSHAQPHYDQRYYGHSPPAPYHHAPPAESPYSPYSHQGYSQSGGYYDQYSPHSEYGRPHCYEDDPYNDNPNLMNPNKNGSGTMLPKAAQEIDFEISDPPMEPITPPSKAPVCESPADVNSYDVLCGRGGGTNSQVGNRRFRRLVQEFQPTYLLARRKEKPLLARTIVLIIRKRGGRFLKKDDESGELYEVGDSKAEAKTSQALREGLDVRATKSAASNLLDKNKKKKKDATAAASKMEENSPVEQPYQQESPKPRERNSSDACPPSLPRLNEEQPPQQCPASPNSTHFRKRRRMRSGDAGDGSAASCGGMGFQDKLFPDFCPPRADLGRSASPIHDIPSAMDIAQIHTPRRNNMQIDDDSIYEDQPHHSQGCTGIALDIVTGAASSSFCLGPRSFRR